jgi:hypothetical protein
MGAIPFSSLPDALSIVQEENGDALQVRLF